MAAKARKGSGKVVDLLAVRGVVLWQVLRDICQPTEIGSPSVGIDRGL